nr:glucosyltransferase domain-containing protein [uncultured Halomonas sp.]
MNILRSFSTILDRRSANNGYFLDLYLPRGESARRHYLYQQDKTTFLAALGLYTLVWFSLSLVNYAYIDDRGRTLWGTLGWEDNGRPLASLVMRLFTLDGRLFDTAPLPQLLAIGVMAASLVLLRRQLHAGFSWGWLVCAAPLFATPLYAENMAYSFDSLTMTLGGLLSVAASGFVWQLRRPDCVWQLGAAMALLVAMLCLYQPMITVFLALCCLHGALAGSVAAWGRLIRGSLRTLATLGVAFALYLAISAWVMPSEGYSAEHSRTFALQELPFGVLHNLVGVVNHLQEWLPSQAEHLLVFILLLAGVALLLHLRAQRREQPVALSAMIVAGFVLLLGVALYGPMLALSDPIWKPRTFVGLGAVVCALLLLGRRLATGRWLQWLVVGAACAFLLMTFASNAIFANLLARHGDNEALVFSRIAQEVNLQFREHQRDRLAIVGRWPFEPVVQRGREGSRLYRHLLPPSLYPGSFWNKPGLELYGMDPRIAPILDDEIPPLETPWTPVQETATYRLEANDRYLRLVLGGSE